MNINKSHTRDEQIASRDDSQVTEVEKHRSRALGLSPLYFASIFPFVKQLQNGKRVQIFLLLAYHLHTAVTAFSPASQASATSAALSWCPANALPGNLQPTPVKCLCPRQTQPSATGSGCPRAGAEMMMAGTL